ncbi:unnamed protein product [Urochloa humidicola]
MSYSGGGNPNRGIANMLSKDLNALFGCVKNVHYDVYEQNEKLSRRIHQVEENQYRLSQALNLQPPIPPVYNTINLFAWENEYFGITGAPEASLSDSGGSSHGHEQQGTTHGDDNGMDSEHVGINDDNVLISVFSRARKGKGKATSSHAHDSDDGMDED